MEWIKKGFTEFSKGTFGNGGRNIYVSAKGILQRIFHYDINLDGYPDLLFCNAQSMGERPPAYVYEDPLENPEPLRLPTGGPYDGVMADLSGNGYDDLVVACQGDGTHGDITSYIYFGSEDGLTEHYRAELPTPDSISVVAGDLTGNGKNDLAFISGHGLRIFYNGEKGIVPFSYTDFPMKAHAVAAADLNGDGFYDLYIKNEDGTGVVYWGGPDGIRMDRMTVVCDMGPASAIEKTTTPNKRAAYRGWRPCIVPVDGEKYLFAASVDNAYFYRYGGDGVFALAFALPCAHAVWAAPGDLDDDGREDLAVLCCKNKAEIKADSYVFWNRDSRFAADHCTLIPTASAQSGVIAPLSAKTAASQLVVCQGGNDKTQETFSQILEFADHKVVKKTELPTSDALRALTGFPKGKDKPRCLVLINHESGRHGGDESACVFLGGPDGYCDDRKLEFPGRGIVDGVLCDFDDDGRVDAFFANCAENAMDLDPGSFLYYNSPEGFLEKNKVVLPSHHAHGCAVGDFDKDGYLEIAVGGINNRYITIFHGGPDGFDTQNPENILLGPQQLFSEEEERTLYPQYGQVRWLFAGDFNNDGWLDLYIPEVEATQTYILWGSPGGFSFERKQILYTGGVTNANATDLTGNGYLDLILGIHHAYGKSPAGLYETYLAIYWGGPEGFKENRRCLLPTYACNGIAVGDFNNDGVLDLYGSTYNTGRNRDLLSYVYFADKPGNFNIYNYQTLFNHSGSGCVAGDFNGDGYTDLAVACHKGNGNHCSESFVFWGSPDGLCDTRKTILKTTGPHGMTKVEPGNIMDRGPDEFYESEIVWIDGSLAPAKASWEGDVPCTCYVQIQFRFAATKEALAKSDWSRRFEKDQDLSELCVKGGFFQYRLILGAKVSCGTPRISSVAISFE